MKIKTDKFSHKFFIIASKDMTRFVAENGIIVTDRNMSKQYSSGAYAFMVLKGLQEERKVYDYFLVLTCTKITIIKYGE